MRPSILLAAMAASVLVPSAAHGQKKWTQIGTTSSGNPVFLDARTVKKSGSLVSATVRVVFVKPVVTPKGPWMSARTIGTFDCAKKSLAAKESIYYGDKAETKVVDRKVNKLPGYGPALDGSLGAIALEHLCRVG